MSASQVTNDEVVNALRDLEREIEVIQGDGTRPALHGDQALAIVRLALLTVAGRLLRGDYGP